MKVRALQIVAGLGLISLLSACGIPRFTSSPTPAPTEAAASQGPVVEVRTTNPANGNTALKCNSSLMSIDVPLGSHKELDGTSYQLIEKKSEPKYDGTVPQDSVALSVKLGDGTALPAMIIHSRGGTGRYGKSNMLNDASLNLQVGKGGTGSFTLPTSAYTEYQTLGDMITGVTLCLDISQSPKTSS